MDDVSIIGIDISKRSFVVERVDAHRAGFVRVIDYAHESLASPRIGRRREQRDVVNGGRRGAGASGRRPTLIRASG